MEADWKSRLKEIGKELVHSSPEKKKTFEDVKPKLPGKKPKTELEVLMEEILPNKASDNKMPKKAIQKEISKEHSSVTQSMSTLTADKDKNDGLLLSNIKQRRPPLPKLPRSGKERVTVGLDFGTSFTKVCLRKELGGDDVPIYPVTLEKDTYNKSASPLCPSLIAIKDKKIYFGQEAYDQALKGARRIEHIKACIDCNFVDSSIDCVFSVMCPYLDGTLSPIKLAALYIGWIMKESRGQASKILKGNQFSFIYNVGVPIKHLDWGKDGQLYQTYRRIFYNAWRISEGIGQGMDLQLALSWLEEITQEAIPSLEDSFVQAAPESSAAIVSYVNSAESQTGLYSIVDIGAWTMDVSFFRLTDIGIYETGVPRLSFYAADVWKKATNAIDEKIVRALMEYGDIKSIKDFSEKENILFFIRSRRENNALNSAEVEFRIENDNLERLEIPSCIVDYVKLIHSEGVRRCFTHTFKEARNKEKTPDIWHNFTLFLTGGGSYETLFGEKILKKYEIFSPRVRSDILTFTALEDNKNPEFQKRLAVAAGLSYPLGMWPEQLHPSQIPDIEKPRMARIQEADDEPG